MKKVLIPTDFSNNAWDALTYAIRLYDDIPCRFYILNTFKAGPSRIKGTMLREKDTFIYRVLRKESEKELKKIYDYLNDNLLNDKHEYKTISKSGFLIDIIKGIISQENIDIIIMGTTGATGAKEIFMGSNTVRVIKQVHECPILSIPKEYKFEYPELVILATDYKRHFTPIELNCLIELQLLHNFKIKIIHVKQEEKDLNELQLRNKRAFKQYFDTDVVSFEEIISKNTVAKTINEYAEKKQIHMGCLINYEHSFIERLTHEPIIKKVSFHCKVPLLIISV